MFVGTRIVPCGKPFSFQEAFVRFICAVCPLGIGTVSVPLRFVRIGIFVLENKSLAEQSSAARSGKSGTWKPRLANCSAPEKATDGGLLRPLFPTETTIGCCGLRLTLGAP